MKRMTLAATMMMMIVALSGCTSKNAQPAAQPKPAKEVASESAQTSEKPAATTLSMNYMDAAAALADDNFERAKASLTALAMESTGELQKLAQACANSADIAAMRESFKALSTFAAGMELPKDYAVAFCPMYQGGAKWVQKKDKIANPYFGKTMLTCGNFVN